MDKISKQLLLNVVLVFFSFIIIFLVRSFAIKKFATMSDCMGSDVIFTMITSLLTTFFWRITEDIQMPFIYNIIILFIMALFFVVYGLAIADPGNKFIIDIAFIFCDVFIFVYVIENIIIVYNLKHRFKEINVVIDYGYKNREDD